MTASPGSGPAVLGLWDGHDAGVAVVADGALIFALSEERPSRRKRYSGFPSRSLALALEFCAGEGVSITDVALAGGAGRLPLRALEPLYRASSPHRSPLSPASRAVAGWENRVARVPGLRSAEAAAAAAIVRTRLPRGLRGLPLHRVDHHDAHAYGAALLPGDGLLLTWDAYGEGRSATLRAAARPETVLAALSADAGPATLYGAVTLHLGFKEGDDGKVMGLAARGDPARCGPALSGLLRRPRDGGAVRLAPGTTPGTLRRLLAGASREDIAAGVQAVTETVVADVLGRWLHRAPTPTRLLLAGGIFANICLNRRLATMDGVTGVAVFPHMGDGGLAAGAAHGIWWAATGARARMHSPLLGPRPVPGAAEAAVRASGLSWRRVDAPDVAAAAHVTAGRVICRYTGRDEYGPRALGNRSVLFRPDRPELIEGVNRALARDDFMPFGPAVPGPVPPGTWADGLGETDLSTMTVAVRASATLAREAAAVIHVDGTVRPQVVSAAESPGYHRLLTEVGRLSGLPCVINTSFNLHGEPIVHSPGDAVRTFMASGLDVLYLDDLELRADHVVA
jgi:carbamoyltransferase